MFIKQVVKVLLTAFTLFPTASALSAADAPISPGLQVIAQDLTLIKTGVAGSDISFTTEDFRDGLGLENLSKITIVSLPPREMGILKLGSLEVKPGDTISKNNISSLRFVPTANCTLETNFEFCLGSNRYGTKYEFDIFALDRINSAPIITQPNEMNTGVYSGIQTFGSINAADPNDDSFEFEIVSYPSHGELLFTDSSLGYYIYTPNEDYSGKDSFSVRAVDRYGAASNTVKVSMNVDTPSSTEIFSDLRGHWANAAVISCRRAGIIESGEYFYPDAPMGRAEFLDFMMNAAGYSGFSTQNTCFADDESIPDEYKGSIALAETLGIISGIEIDGEMCFCPNNQITRAEAAVIVAKLGNISTSDSVSASTDDSIPTWARASMEGLRSVGVLRGKATGNEISLAPYDVITRAAAAQIAAMLFIK